MGFLLLDIGLTSLANIMDWLWLLTVITTVYRLWEQRFCDQIKLTLF